MAQDHPAHGIALGAPAPDFSLPARDGTFVSLGDVRGRQPVVLVFYRGWW